MVCFSHKIHSRAKMGLLFKRKENRRMKKIAVFFLLSFFIFGCATAYESGGAVSDSEGQQKASVSFPEYKGEKTRIAVLPIAMSKKAVADYPEYTAELKKQSVGFSLWNKITDALYDTNRFTFVEVSEEIVKSVIDQWWLSESGMVDPSAALKAGKLKQAQDFIYGEITEFGVDNVAEVKGLKSKQQKIYRIGVHIRYVNGQTLEYVPATGIGKGDSIDSASELAIRNAVLKLTERINK
jgi:curli biogenesis system outer membrane secretion channel CsgG